MIKLLVDCTCEMDLQEAEKLGIILMPMAITFGDQEYLAGVNLSNAEFYQKLATSKTNPQTSQINPAAYVAAIKPWLDAGDQVFAMSISSGLSGTFQSLTLAAAELNSPNLQIFDTETFTIGYYALVKEAHRLINAGVSLVELTEKMSKLREKVRIYTIIDQMKYLMRSGRISFAKGLLAKALHIKPIIGVINKKLATVAKAIGYNSAQKHLIRLTQNIDLTMPRYYGHANAKEKAEAFKKNFDFDFMGCREIGPIIGTHGGPGCVGLAFFTK